MDNLEAGDRLESIDKESEIFNIPPLGGKQGLYATALERADESDIVASCQRATKEGFKAKHRWSE